MVWSKVSKNKNLSPLFVIPWWTSIAFKNHNHKFFFENFENNHYKKTQLFLWLKKPPMLFFWPNVQLDQIVILDKSIWIQPFWLGFFGWSIWLGILLLSFFIKPPW